MLYRPEQFDPLSERPWDVAAVRAAIRALAADAEEAFDFELLWPPHEWDAWQARLPLTSLYVGAAGVLWAVDALARRGYHEPRLDLHRAALRTLEAWREAPDYAPGEGENPQRADDSLWSGESGILLVAYRLAPAPALADALHTRVLRNVDNETNELMWGSPGTMLAARAMLDGTGDERWAAAWRASADELWRRREPDGLWTQEVWGSRVRALGAAHGAVTIVSALLQGDFPHRDELERDMNDVLARTAVLEDGLANWPGSEGRPLEFADGQIRLQWDATGPGIVASAASYLDEELLLSGAELVWRAGPHGDEKGAGLCHGTAGNGYALLKTFGRTGDERWLERARRFAVHALEQAQRLPPRYSLFTGGVGAALFAADCLDMSPAFPTVDAW